MESIVVARPPGAQNLCLDKGYGQSHRPRDSCRLPILWTYPAHWGGEAGPMGRESLPRPTVGGGTQLGLALQVPGDIGALRQNPANYLGLIQLACALIWNRPSATPRRFEIVTKKLSQNVARHPTRHSPEGGNLWDSVHRCRYIRRASLILR